MKLTLARHSVYDLVPYEKNSKRHSEEDIDAIAASIERFGFNDPIAITDEGVIVEGHGRWHAAQKLGMEDVPVLLIEDADEAELDLYRIAHNKIALSSTFDYGALFATLQELVGEGGMAFQDMGFSDQVVDNLFSHFGTPEEGAEEGASSLMADGTAPVYEIIWDTKEDKTRFSLFMAEEVKNGADKATGGETLLSAIARFDPNMHARLVEAVPGEVPLDQQAGHVEAEEAFNAV